MYTTCAPGALGGQNRVTDPLELELWTVESRHVDQELQPLKCSEPLSHLSSPQPLFEKGSNIAQAGLNLVILPGPPDS